MITARRGGAVRATSATPRTPDSRVRYFLEAEAVAPDDPERTSDWDGGERSGRRRAHMRLLKPANDVDVPALWRSGGA